MRALWASVRDDAIGSWGRHDGTLIAPPDRAMQPRSHRAGVFRRRFRAPSYDWAEAPTLARVHTGPGLGRASAPQRAATGPPDAPWKSPPGPPPGPGRGRGRSRARPPNSIARSHSFSVPANCAPAEGAFTSFSGVSSSSVPRREHAVRSLAAAN
ncbi:hypothetical protein PHLGIDRAFT_309336 [Phlebiopsis gigantea 11061_1 CR5-6]|uniref:Uncharacterized protein n=1 Tax=Phlebiopsis gigantea (strain 11061_1 CR5-6) TaxID=745531 RepID=A0A0C3RQK0_PHLG1|nr:hypothetical protein PHLGIDRAFT_309336 [Phlebiopsis gigantea 11061_1 CR5-6]